ncbi:MAG: CHAT domain-containing protein [Pseudomonadota bacterium]
MYKRIMLNKGDVFRPGRDAFLVAVSVVFSLLLQGCVTVPETAASPGQLQTFIASGKQSFLDENYTKAADTLTRAVTMAHELDERKMAAETGLLLSRTLEVLGSYEKSLVHADNCTAASAEGSWIKVGCLNMKSLVSRRMGLNKSAVSQAKAALEVALVLSDRRVEAESRRNLGAALKQSGEDGQVRVQYEQSLKISQEIDDEMGVIKSLNNIGGWHRSRAEYTKALDYYNRALEMSRNAGSRIQQSKLNGNLCALFYNQSDYSRAMDYCRISLKQAQQINALPQVTSATHNIAAIYMSLGKRSKSLDYYKRAAETKRRMEDRPGLARSLNNIGKLYGSYGRYADADRYLAEALQINRELDNRSGQAANYGNLCLFSNTRKRYGDALQQCQSALTLWLTVNRPEELWRTYDNMSISYTGLGNPGAAIFFGKQAVNVLQGIRNANLELQDSYRKKYIGTRMDVYRRLADLLIEFGRFLEAEQVLAMLKEEEYFNFIRRRGNDMPGDTQASLNGHEQAVNNEYIEITNRLAQIGMEYRQLRKIDSSTRSEVEQARYTELRAQLKLATREFGRFLSELKTAQVFPEGERSFSVAELEALTAFRGTLEILDKSAVAIHFLAMPDKLHIIVTSSKLTTPIYRDVDISYVALSREILAFREILQDPPKDPLPKAKQLYDYLLKPVEETLTRLGAHTLVLYLDLDLRYLPISALHDGDQYIAEKYGTVIYTPAVKQNLVERSGQPWKVAAMGVSKPHSGFPALPSVIGEVDGIVKENNTDQGALPGVRHLNDAFTKNSFSNVLTGNEYTVIHIASHFKLDPTGEADSFLLIGDGSRLYICEIYDFDYPLTGVDLLTLSACQTGLGGDGVAGQEIEAVPDRPQLPLECQAEPGGGSVAGQEVESFSAFAQKRGARSVMATLWSVADDSTGKFMQYFYQLHEDHDLSKSEAIRLTQELFIKGEIQVPDGELATFRGIERSDMPDQPLPYSHPFFWAPFVLSGNWL